MNGDLQTPRAVGVGDNFGVTGPTPERHQSFLKFKASFSEEQIDLSTGRKTLSPVSRVSMPVPEALPLPGIAGQADIITSNRNTADDGLHQLRLNSSSRFSEDQKPQCFSGGDIEKSCSNELSTLRPVQFGLPEKNYNAFSDGNGSLRHENIDDSPSNCMIA